MSYIDIGNPHTEGRDCRYCDGSGQIWNDKPMGSHELDLLDCPYCDGTGEDLGRDFGDQADEDYERQNDK